MGSGLRAALDRGLLQIEEDLLRMREMIDRALSKSLKSLVDRDTALAHEVIDEDKSINNLRYKIEEACLALIATQQPTASDLRMIMAIMSVVADLERMGDYAAGISKTVLRMGDEPLLKPLIDIPKMVDLARTMLRGSIQALLDHDVPRAREIASRDDEMDHLYQAIFDELVEIMARKPESVHRATYLLWCAHNLERIGDRVTNIAERVVFVSTGDFKDLNIKEEGIGGLN
ncbi:MAG: phosphate transport system regulatory protein PhoU [Chloroflexi bacterium RBG_16_48_8]|nr:MAG: phosphate transport system regulatory protein PhoU [Chloroflexi bacterium RBG_16_48_8]